MWGEKSQVYVCLRSGNSSLPSPHSAIIQNYFSNEHWSGFLFEWRVEGESMEDNSHNDLQRLCIVYVSRPPESFSQCKYSVPVRVSFLTTCVKSRICKTSRLEKASKWTHKDFLYSRYLWGIHTTLRDLLTHEISFLIGWCTGTSWSGVLTWQHWVHSTAC